MVFGIATLSSGCLDEVLGQDDSPEAGGEAPASGGTETDGAGCTDVADASVMSGGTDMTGTGGMDMGTGGVEVVITEGETGRMEGITAAHNDVRTPLGLDPLEWSPEIAEVAQAWADNLAADCLFDHSMGGPYGENLASFGSTVPPNSTSLAAVDGWSAEVQCWTYGTIKGTEMCDMECTADMFASGCGHYTQVVWENTKRVGCGVAMATDCEADQGTIRDIWVCNYDPPGNYIGEAPY